MSIRDGAAQYRQRHGKGPTTDLKTLAAGSSVGLGRVRHMALKGDQEARQVLRDLKVEPPQQRTEYDE